MAAADGRTAHLAGPGAGASHEDVGEELRLLGLALLDRVEPRMRSVLAGLRVEAAEAAGGGTQDRDDRPAACQWCPLCAAIALFRGEAPELGGRLAEHGDELLTALRGLLERPAANGDGTTADAHASGPNGTGNAGDPGGGC